jgi:folate-dependent phosphoribosylglycinamide formyltransferase PurN
LRVDDEQNHASRPLSVVVITSAAMGVELAGKLALVPEVRSLTVVTTRVMPGSRTLWQKLRGIHRTEGIAGVLRSVAARMRPFAPNNIVNLARRVAERCPTAQHLHFEDLHAPESLARLRSLAPDLGVVFGSYRLKPCVFTIPRLGCINLHLGLAPEFRGSSPAFYEMLEGVPTVGVTIHRMDEGLDSGPIIKQESFPIDLAPKEDPLAYLQRYQREVLVPNGIRMMADAVRAAARGSLLERPQPPAVRPLRRRATYQLKCALRRQVAWRRQA